MTVIHCSGCRHARPGGVVSPYSPCATCTTSTTDGAPSNYSPAEYTVTSQASEKISAKALDTGGGDMIQYGAKS